MATKPTILYQEPLTLSETKEILKKLEKEKGQLNYRANKTYEFLKSLKILPKKDADELFVKLNKAEIPRLKDHHIKKIIDLMPTTEQELDIIFYGATISISKESKKKIRDILSEYYDKVK
ncbi:MAG: hypothetical protein QW594_02605 [Candidatus Woesearchaeota archaeon]